MRLDLGCGRFPREGYEGVDIAPLGQRFLCDLDAPPWPFEDSSVDGLYTSHLVEHVADLIAFMDECWRVLEPGGTLEILHPYGWSDRAWQDPTHKRALVEASWFYYDAEWRETMGLGHYPIRADFSIKSMDVLLSPEWAARRSQAHLAGVAFDDSKLRNGVNIIDDLHVVLEARKLHRVGGGDAR